MDILQTVPYICLVFLLKFSPNTTKPRHLYEKWQQHMNVMLPIIVNQELAGTPPLLVVFGTI